MDHDDFSLDQAVRAAPPVRFVRGTALELPFRGLGAILVSDVLYLLPAEGQVAVLAECRTALAAGGTLILKTTDLTPRWKHWWNIIQETTVVRVLGLTKGAGGFSFPGRRGFEALLASAGFHVDRCVPLGQGYLHAHIAIVARRNA